MVTITFNTKGYDGFIDFIKAYAIVCVLFGHTFLWLDKVAYDVWAGMQVPLFLLVQSFHAYKKDKTQINIKKLMKRVMVPFLILEVLTFAIALLIGRGDCKSLAISALNGGGYGPGSYYPWVYLQVALMLPLFRWLLSKCSRITALLVMLLLCEGLEIFASLICVPEWIYRLLAVRYFFLLYFGWQWVKEGIKVNWLTILLSLMSLAAIIYFEYYSVNDEPCFFNTHWKTHRWPCYFFVAYGFTAFLYKLYNRIRNITVHDRIVKVLAGASYEIFLIQMSLIFLFNYQAFTFTTCNLLNYIVWLLIVWSVSLVGGVVLNKILYKGQKLHLSESHNNEYNSENKR